ncbi:MAG: DUF3108 domain-containing protein [Dokdonella sp.]
MKTLFASLLLVFSAMAVGATAAPTATGPAIKPFRADYVTMRDGKALGETRIEWSANADGSYTLRTTTRGTSGLAKLAGLDVSEESTVRWRDGLPETTKYDFKQDVAFSKRSRHADIDWTENRVSMKDNDKRASYETVPGMVDRHAVMLALANDLAHGNERYAYKVAMKDKVETFDYAKLDEKSIKVPAGDYTAVPMEQVRGPRTSTIWFAERAGWIPVQIEQVDEKKGETITLQLKSVKR